MRGLDIQKPVVENGRVESSESFSPLAGIRYSETLEFSNSASADCRVVSVPLRGLDIQKLEVRQHLEKTKGLVSVPLRGLDIQKRAIAIHSYPE